MNAALDDVFIDEISFPATDGYALTGTLFLPARICPRASSCNGPNGSRARAFCVARRR